MCVVLLPDIFTMEIIATQITVTVTSFETLSLFRLQ
jgi:hypothetical protein